MSKLFYILLLPAFFMACTSNDKKPQSLLPSKSEMELLTSASEPLAELLQPNQLDFALNVDGAAYSLNKTLLKSAVLPNAFYNVNEDVTVIWLRGLAANNPSEELFFELIIRGKVTENSRQASKVTFQIARVGDNSNNESVFLSTATDMPISINNLAEHALTNENNAFSLELSFEGTMKKVGGGSAVISGGKFALVY